MTPPARFATWLIDVTLPPDLSEAIAGDLWEEFMTATLPTRGPLFAQTWFVWQVVRSATPLLYRSWQRASLRRVSAAMGVAAVIAVMPALGLLWLRTFVLQQVPLKTTAELSLTFAATLAALVLTTTVVSVVIAVRLVRHSPPLHRREAAATDSWWHRRSR